MKKLSTLLSIFLVSFFIQKLPAQDRVTKKRIEQEKKTFVLARKYMDVGAMQNALMRIIAAEGDHSTYRDTLAALYEQTGQFLSLLPLAEDLLKQDPKNETYLYYKALALEKTKRLKEAVDAYQQLFDLNKKVETGYHLGKLQYAMKRSAEAYATFSALHPDDFKEGEFDLLPAGNNQSQKVPVKAAYYYYLGMTAYDLHNPEMAVKFFGKALEVYPDFALAKQNKQALEISLKQKKKEPKKSGN